jgi:hypothetical protein
VSSRRFVVQRHDVRPGEVHWDLMVEDGAVLVTFQLDAPPEGEVSGRRSFDHRERYLDYEGPISGDRGSVAIWDRGRAHDLEGTPRGARWTARFEGARMSGEWELSGGLAEKDPVRLRLVPPTRAC